MSTLTEYRLRIRDAGNTVDAITITSVRGDTAPYIKEAPKGDGASFDPVTGQSMVAAYTGTIVDWPIGSAQRVLTSQLEDGSFRQQLGYRRAFVEYRQNGGAWNVLVAGVLTLLRLTDALTWEFTVNDFTRAHQGAQAFGASANTTTITSILSQYTTGNFARGCLFGGPFWGTFELANRFRDLGGWQMRVNRVGTAPDYNYYLEPTMVYGPPSFVTGPRPKLTDFSDAINQAATRYYQNVTPPLHGAAFTTLGDALANTWWSGLVYVINDGVNTSDGVNGWVPYRPTWGAAYSSQYYNANDPNQLVSTIKGKLGIFCAGDGQTHPLTPGAIVSVRCLSILPTEDSPIYFDGHPVDGSPKGLMTALWSNAGIPYDATAASAFASTIGTANRIALRITASQDMSSLIQQAVCLPYGVGIRSNGSGQLVPFASRVMGNTPPSTTITNADIIDASTSLPFELDTSGGLASVKLTHQSLQPVTIAGGSDTTLDGVVVNDISVLMLNTDTTGLPFGTVEINVPGMMHYVNSPVPRDPASFTTIAAELFDRFGHGSVALETTFKRGGSGDSVQLGDEVLVQIGESANHNYRLSDNLAIAARAMQVVRLTELPEGRAVRLLDSGPNAQPLPTVPTITVALSSDLPRTVATYTITNAATLNGLGYACRVQWVANAGTTPAAGDYSQIAYFTAGLIPTGAQRLPSGVAGSTVWVNARSEKAGSRPSNYGATAHIALSAVADPSGVTATPSGTDASLCVLTWTPGSGTTADLVDVWLRLSGQTFAQAARLITLTAGSVKYTLEGLTTGVVYIATVQYRDPRSQDVSDPIDVTFTAGATTRTLSAPVSPNGFSGSIDPTTGAPRRDGTYGIVVLAAEIPGYVEVQEAVETAAGSGTYGSFATVGRIASAAGAWTVWQNTAPNDGLRRQLQARHAADGCTSSAFTSVVTVTPWTFSAIPPLPTNIICEVTMLTPSPSTDAGINLRFQVDGVDPFGTVCQVEVVSVQGSGVAIVSGPSAGTLSANDTVWKVSQPTSGSGPGTIVCRAQSPDGRKADVSITVPEQASVALPQGTGSVSANGVASFVVDLPPNCNSFKSLGSTSAYPTAASTVSGGVLTNTPGGGVTTIAGLTLAFGATEFLTIVPFTGSSASGTQLQSIHLQAAYQDTTGNTKFDSYGGAQFVLRDPTITSARADTATNVFLADASSNPTKPQAAVGLKISNNITITSVSLTGKLNFTSGTTERLTVAVIAINKASGGITTVGQPETNSASSAVQSVTVSGLSHAVDTNTNTYIGRLLLADSGGTGTALELWSLTIAYTQNHTNQGT